MHSGSKTKVLTFSFFSLFLLNCIAGHFLLPWCAAQTAGAENVEGEYPRNINVKQAAEKRENGAFILDVREPSEWTQVHIPESVLIPLSQLQNRLDEIPADREIIVVCGSGRRSLRALDIIRKKGFPKSSSMYGGIQLWQEVGYPVEKGT